MYTLLGYLWAPKFLAKPVVSFVNTEILPNGERVGDAALAEFLCYVAFIDLVRNGFISLQIQEKKVLFVSSKELYAEKKSDNDGRETGLEADLLINATPKPKVLDNVASMIRKMCEYPWGDIIKIVKNDLVQQGFLSTKSEKKLMVFTTTTYELVPDKVSQLESSLLELQEAIVRFENDNPEIVKLLKSAISKGIKSRQYIETPPVD